MFSPLGWYFHRILTGTAYALVICNHGPPHPRGSAGDSRGNERCFDKSFATAVQGKYPGFALYRQKGQ